MSNITLPKTHTPTEGKVTKLKPGVAVGLKKTDYVEREVSETVRTASVKITSDDPKYDMYANALPKPIRQKVVDLALDVRALYKEYRKIGRDAMVAKYA